MEKFVYIKNNHSNEPLEFNEAFDEKLFDNVGSSWQDYIDGKWVRLSDKQIEFMENNHDVSIKEIWDMKIQPKEETVIEQEEKLTEVEHPKISLERKIEEIDGYDKNVFSLNGKDIWLDAQQRQDILDDAKAFRSENVMEMTKWLDGTEYTRPLHKWIALVNRIRIYDNKVQNAKEAHKSAVRALKSDEEIDIYDYTSGYPEKITIEF